MQSHKLFTVLAVLVAAAAGGASAGGPASAGNGYAMMIHAHFEPWVNDASDVFVPPVVEGVAATNQDGRILIQAIPFSAATGLPVVVSTPVLHVARATGTLLAEFMMVTPNGNPSGNAICEAETNLPGHAGPIEACLVFDIDANVFTPGEVVVMWLSFSDATGKQVEMYNAASHYALHGAMEGAPFSYPEADALSGLPTPFVIEALLDTGF